MITDAAVETATAVLEERGWERDDEMVEDVRAALEAAQAELVAAALAEEKRRLSRELGGRPEPTLTPAGSGAEIAVPLGRVPSSNPR